jgi:hypothetical protein
LNPKTTISAFIIGTIAHPEGFERKTFRIKTQCNYKAGSAGFDVVIVIGSMIVVSFNL